MNPPAKARVLATIALQRPTLAPYREPATLRPLEVCPRCKTQVTEFRFLAEDGVWVTTYHCREHGDVFPMRSHIANPASIANAETG